jgi:hypothetical protein
LFERFHSLQFEVIVLLLWGHTINLDIFKAFRLDFVIIFLLNFTKNCIQINVSKIALKLLLSEVISYIFDPLFLPICVLFDTLDHSPLFEYFKFLFNVICQLVISFLLDLSQRIGFQNNHWEMIEFQISWILNLFFQMLIPVLENPLGSQNFFNPSLRSPFSLKRLR